MARRNRRVSIYLTDAEAARCQVAADADHRNNLGEWARAIVLKYLDNPNGHNSALAAENPRPRQELEVMAQDLQATNAMPDPASVNPTRRSGPDRRTPAVWTALPDQDARS